MLGSGRPALSSRRWEGGGPCVVPGTGSPVLSRGPQGCVCARSSGAAPVRAEKEAASHLREILLRDACGPLDALLPGPARVGHVRALDQHPFDQSPVLGRPEHSVYGVLLLISFLKHERNSEPSNGSPGAVPGGGCQAHGAPAAPRLMSCVPAWAFCSSHSKYFSVAFSFCCTSSVVLPK